MRPIVHQPAGIGTSAAARTVDANQRGPLELLFLGTFCARQDGRDLVVRLPRHSQRVLAYVLLSRDAQPRERIAFALWPDEAEADARANLRRQIHLLQRAFPSSVQAPIVTTATTVARNEAAVSTDVAEFERLCGKLETAQAADRLYAGDLLPDLDDDWILQQRERIRALALQNCAQLVEHYRRRHELGPAIHYAQRLRSLDPWREDTVRALVALRLEAGDRAGALAEFERFRTALFAELRVAPMPETVCVYERAVADAGEPVGANVVQSDRTRVETLATAIPFVGRHAELERLISSWNEASNGTGSTALIAGEAGIGKSRVIDALCAHIDAAGGRIVRGSTSPLELGPYQAIAEALRGALPMVRRIRLDPVWLAALTPLVPQIAVDVARLPMLTSLDADAERTRLFEAVVSTIAALAAVRPVVVILEDLHWAGPASIALFEYVARRAPANRCLLIGSYREDDVDYASPLRAVRRRLEREHLLHVTALGALTAADIGEIVATLVDEPPSRHTALVGELLAASDGNPLIINEIITNDREAGILDTGGRRWHVNAGPTQAFAALTSTLRERLERLTPQTRSLLEIAAVIGRSFSAELVRAVSGLDERTVLDCLSELTDRRLVREVGTAYTDFAFTHQLIAQAIYVRIPADALQRRHRRVAGLIEEMYGEDLEQLAGDMAFHLERAHESERAAEYWRLAARQALELYAYDEAKTSATAGLRLATDDDNRIALFGVLEEAHCRLGERDEQRLAIAQMLSIAQRIGRTQAVCDVLRRRVAYAHACAERDDEREMIALLERTHAGDAPWPATVAQLKAAYLIAIGEYAQARRSISTALAMPSIAAYPKLLLDCRCTLVEVAGFDGSTDEIAEFLTEATGEHAPRYDDALEVTLLEAACSAASRLQEYAMLARIAERLLELSRATGYREGEAAAYKFAGRAAFRLFEPERAAAYLERALSLFESVGQRLKSVHVLSDIGNLATSVGRFDTAIVQLTHAEAIADTIGYGFGQAACANNISYAAYLAGDFITARSAAERALAAAESLDAPSARAHALVNIGVALRELGFLDESIVKLEAGVLLERQLGERVALGEDLCELAIACIRAGAFARAKHIATEVLELLERAVTFTHPQFLYWTAAVAIRHSGDTARAQTLLAHAHASMAARQSEIRDPSSRETFRQLPYNQAIDAAYKYDRWTL